MVGRLSTHLPLQSDPVRPATGARPLPALRAPEGRAQASERLPSRSMPADAALEQLFALNPGRFLRRVPRRETFAWDDAGGGHVVKRFRGDPVAEGAGLFAWPPGLGAARSPARMEAENLLALAAAGVRVPRLEACWDEPSGRRWPGPRWGRSAVVMERVEHSWTLRTLARRDPHAAERSWLAPLAELVAGLHAAGWYHRDLYLHHVVLDARGELVLFDVGRARRGEHVRARWFVKDLAALDLSTPAAVGERARLRFLVRYARAAGGRGRARLRRLARAVRAKSERMAAHVPRHVDPGDRASREDA